VSCNSYLKQISENDADPESEFIPLLRKINLLNRNTSSNQHLLSPVKTPIKSLELNIAQRCNMRCIYCYGDQGTYRNPGFMNQKIAGSVLDWISENRRFAKKVSIIFFGGEPLLNFKLLKWIVTNCRERTASSGQKFRFAITTNGSFFRSEIVDFLNQHRFSVTVSLDGDSAVQNRNRPFKNGALSYQKIAPDIVNFLKTRNGQAFARATLAAGFNGLQPILGTLQKLGFKRYDYAMVSGAGTKPFLLTDRDFATLLADLEIVCEKYLQEFCNNGGVSSPRILALIQALKSKKPVQYFCGAGKGMLAVSSSGEIFPCHRFVGWKKMQMGTITNYSDSARDSYFNLSVAQSQICKDCWVRNLCGGGCMYENMVYSGNLLTPNTRHCLEMKKRTEMVIYICDRLRTLNKAKLN